MPRPPIHRAAPEALLALALAALAAAPRAGATPVGWMFHAGEKGKPAVLLVHGLVSSTVNWSEPARAWNIRPAHFRHQAGPGAESGEAEHPRAGAHRFVLSPLDEEAGTGGSFWSFLTARGFTVASWNQMPCIAAQALPTVGCLDGDTFDAAYASARAAFEELARKTDPATPIALVAHSRGGLVARRLLKEQGMAGLERVRWLVTLHTPNHGTRLAAYGADLRHALARMAASLDLAALPAGPIREGAKKLSGGAVRLLDEAARVLSQNAALQGVRELQPGGNLLKKLEAGEVRRPGVRYISFGGTSPRVVRLHLLAYTPASAEPHLKKGKPGLASRPHTVYRWATTALSVFDFPKDLQVNAAEMKEGGDLMVNDQSSRLPFDDLHFSRPLNHAEVLWSREVQAEVARLLLAPAR